MANTHPYISGAGNIAQMVTHLRKNFPSTVNSETVKKLGLAPKNESYVINALQFVGMIDEESKKTDIAAKVFASHKDEDFHNAFSEMVSEAYSDLFDIHGDAAWKLSKDDLITFFRQSDQTSHAIGLRQANTFLVFAALAGHGELPGSKTKNSSANAENSSPSKSKPVRAAKAQAPKNPSHQATPKGEGLGNDIGLSVKVEINLPSDADAETYDNIFKSIRKNLLDG